MVNEIWNIIINDPFINITFFGGFIFIVSGFILYKYPPKKINYLYGYRTASSMENKEKWDFAQKYSSVVMMKHGLLFLSNSYLGTLFHFDDLIKMFLGLGLMIIMIVSLITKTEKALKTKFEES